MDKFRNGYIFGFVSAIACVLLSISLTLPSVEIDNKNPVDSNKTILEQTSERIANRFGCC